MKGAKRPFRAAVLRHQSSALPIRSPGEMWVPASAGMTILSYRVHLHSCDSCHLWWKSILFAPAVVTGQVRSFVPGGTQVVSCPRHPGMNPWAIVWVPKRETSRLGTLFRPPGFPRPAAKSSAWMLIFMQHTCLPTRLYIEPRLPAADVWHYQAARSDLAGQKGAKRDMRTFG